MDSSESSSEDECNIYVNAASKLNGINFNFLMLFNCLRVFYIDIYFYKFHI
jgi:hypothetical protein